jgi:hypothetical protein
MLSKDDKKSHVQIEAFLLRRNQEGSSLAFVKLHYPNKKVSNGEICHSEIVEVRGLTTVG